jgi:hypothetical protein
VAETPAGQLRPDSQSLLLAHYDICHLASVGVGDRPYHAAQPIAAAAAVCVVLVSIFFLQCMSICCRCRYLALVTGRLDGSGVIDFPLEGKPAITLFRVEKHSPSGEHRDAKLLQHIMLCRCTLLLAHAAFPLNALDQLQCCGCVQVRVALHVQLIHLRVLNWTY